jgi:hypothetical protein
MSGDGIVSVRLPETLLQALRSAAEKQGHTIHSAAQVIVESLASLTANDFHTLVEPPHEIENPRISFYVGWQCVDALAAATDNINLSPSGIFRRVLFALLVCRSLEIVQGESGWNFRLRLRNSQ